MVSPTLRGLAAAVFVLGLTLPASAQTFNVSGTVNDTSPSPVSGAVVRALEDNSLNIVASDTTTATGAYSLSLAPGTYDISVVPPFGSGLVAQTIQDVAVAADVTLDATLLAATNSILSGTLRGRSLQPIPNAFVRSFTAAFELVDTFTDAAGRYSLPVGDGTVFILGTGQGPAGVAPPSYSFERFGITVAGATTHDVDLPVAQISGTVSDPSSNPVSGVLVQLGSSTFEESAGYSSFASLTTDANGDYSTLMVQGTGNVTATPPVGSLFLPVSDTFTLGATDLVKDLTLGSPVTLTGKLRGRTLQPIPDASVSAFVGGVFASTTTNATGDFSLQVASGTAVLLVNGNGPAGVAPASFSYQRFDVEVTGPTTVVNIDLPVVQLSGIVRDASSTAVAGATVDANTSGSDGVASFFGSATTTTGALGQYSLLLVAGVGAVTAFPPSGSPFLAVTQPLDLPADTVMDLQFGAATELSGTVRGRGNEPIPGATVRAVIDFTLLETTTDSAGHYELAVPAGTLSLFVFGSGPAGVAPLSFQVDRPDIVITSPTTIDITLTTALVSGLVTDSNGVPIPNVSVDSGTSASVAGTNFSAFATSVTDADGAFEALLITGDGAFTTFPPPIFTSELLPVTLAGDQAANIVLNRNDFTAPIITAGPTVAHLSDGSATIAWTTNEASSSRVDFGDAGLTSFVEDGTLTTNHLVTIGPLAPGTLYEFRTASTDALTNGPTQSAIATFTTPAAPGDETEPVISDLAVLSISDTSAIVQWTTDEPASSLVEFGSTATLGSFAGAAGFKRHHSVLLTGLTPSTDYFVRVTSADPDGNSSTTPASSSSPFEFTTTADPDTAPPVITAGPTIDAITDTTIIVRWTTNEPATSGVSFNDGSVYDLVDDPTLVTEHVLTLAGLNPATEYFLTVSSTDVYGNGPTLSDTFSATTDATADVTPPVISDPAVIMIGEESARVVWTTNEQATSEVAFGTVSGAPDNIASIDGLRMSHQLDLTGLTPDTDYFAVIRTTDAAGNQSISAELSFHTLADGGDEPPTKPGPLTGPSSPTRLDPYTISWAPSTDDIGLVSYELLRNGVVVGSTVPTVTEVEEVNVPEGAYEYVVRVTDTGGNTVNSDPLQIVVDRTPPVIDTAPDVVAEATSPAGALVTFASPAATDTVDPSPVVACVPASGSVFPLGPTTVECTATDAAGNFASSTFTVTVQDTTDPVIETLPDLTVEATSPAGATVTFPLPTATDIADPSPVVECAPPSGATFPLGSTLVTCTATDASNNQASSTFTVTVVDTTAPVIVSVTPSKTVLWPPNHQMVEVSVAIVATDAVSPVTCQVTAVTSNEAQDAPGSGNTPIDWIIAAPQIVLLRAERSGQGNGRIYTLHVTCSDLSGNSSTATATVSVPKNKP